MTGISLPSAGPPSGRTTVHSSRKWGGTPVSAWPLISENVIYEKSSKSASGTIETKKCQF